VPGSRPGGGWPSRVDSESAQLISVTVSKSRAESQAPSQAAAGPPARAGSGRTVCYSY
jgi:hypothetical protein